MIDPKKIKTEKNLSHSAILFRLAQTPDPQQFYFGASDFNVYRAAVSEDKLESECVNKHESYVTGLALIGDVLISGGYDGKLLWTEAASGQEIRRIDAHSKWIRNLKATPDGKRVVTVADDMVARVWDVETGKLLHELRGHQEKTPNHYPSMLFAVSVSADGKRVATGDKVGHIVVWDAESGKQMISLESPGHYTWDPRARRHSIGGVRSVAFSGDGKLLATGGIGRIGNVDHLGGKARVEIFDLEKKESVQVLESDQYKGLVEQLVFDPAGKWLFAAGGDHGGFYIFYDLTAFKVVQQDKAPMHIHDVAFTPDQTRLVACGHQKLALWNLDG